MGRKAGLKSVPLKHISPRSEVMDKSFSWDSLLKKDREIVKSCTSSFTMGFLVDPGLLVALKRLYSDNARQCEIGPRWDCERDTVTLVGLILFGHVKGWFWPCLRQSHVFFVLLDIIYIIIFSCEKKDGRLVLWYYEPLWATEWDDDDDDDDDDCD